MLFVTYNFDVGDGLSSILHIDYLSVTNRYHNETFLIISITCFGLLLLSESGLIGNEIILRFDGTSPMTSAIYTLSTYIIGYILF